MKIAEALLLRADLKKKLASLRERVAANALVQDKEKPHEDPAKLIKEAVAAVAELEAIGLRIDAANQAKRLADGRRHARGREAAEAERRPREAAPRDQRRHPGHQLAGRHRMRSPGRVPDPGAGPRG